MTRDEFQDYMNYAELIRFQTVPYLKFIKCAFQERTFLIFNSKFRMVTNK